VGKTVTLSLGQTAPASEIAMGQLEEPEEAPGPFLRAQSGQHELQCWMISCFQETCYFQE